MNLFTVHTRLGTENIFMEPLRYLASDRKLPRTTIKNWLSIVMEKKKQSHKWVVEAIQNSKIENYWDFFPIRMCLCLKAAELSNYGCAVVPDRARTTWDWIFLFSFSWQQSAERLCFPVDSSWVAFIFVSGSNQGEIYQKSWNIAFIFVKIQSFIIMFFVPESSLT